MEHIVSYSGGVSSWCAAKRVVEAHGPERVTLLFADTKMEDEDLYRFLRQGADVLGAKLVTIADGRTPWQVFRDERFLGNHRVDPCSKVLKRELLDRWVRGHYGPDECLQYVGIDWTEDHRLVRLREARAPYQVLAPLCDPPFLIKTEMLMECAQVGIEPPRLYAMGYPHNNCGGFCVKAGQAQFRLLLATNPERYAYHEAEEESLRELLGNVSIMCDRRGLKKGEKRRPLTMRAFRERLQADQADCDAHEWGGCGCGV